MGAVREPEVRRKHLAASQRRRRPGEITCKVCGKPSTERDRVWMGRRCTDCTNAWQRHNAATNPVTQRKRLGAQLRHHYSLSLDQWDAMIERQGGACAICGHIPDGSRGRRDNRLHVDHDHKSNRVRALLCHPCNVLIGYAKECPDRLRKAAAYVANFT